MTQHALDVCAGIGGWEIALAEREIRGMAVENATWPRRSLEANGIPIVHSDVLDLALRPDRFAGITALVGGPPCPPWSQATLTARGLDDPRAALMHAFRDLALRLRPPIVCGENVAKSEPVWRAIGADLERLGYLWDVRLVNAADYGDHQARTRALFVARRCGHAPAWPAPTHVDPRRRGPGSPFPPWRTLADLLGRRFDGLQSWANGHPCTTVVATFDAHMHAPPTYRRPGDPPRQHTPGAIELTHAERLRVQGFPSRWQVLGPKTARDLQIGNAIPPTLARVALHAALEHHDGKAQPLRFPGRPAPP